MRCELERCDATCEVRGARSEVLQVGGEGVEALEEVSFLFKYKTEKHFTFLRLTKPDDQ